MPEWFVKDLIFKKAEELGVELKADGGRIGFAEGPKPVLPKINLLNLELNIKTPTPMQNLLNY